MATLELDAEQPVPKPTLTADPVATGPAADAVTDQSVYGRILDGFKEGAAHGWGTEKVGFSDDSIKALRDNGVFMKDHLNVLKAFNEAWMRPAATILDGALRGINAAAYGAGHALIASDILPKQAARDIAALPGMWQGGPLGMGKLTPASRAQVRTNKLPYDRGPAVAGGLDDRPNLPVARDMGVTEAKPPITEGTPAEAAANAVKPIEAAHASPYSFDSFSMEKIGEGQGAQSYGHGLYFSTSPEVHAAYMQEFGSNKGAFDNTGARDLARYYLKQFEWSPEARSLALSKIEGDIKPYVERGEPLEEHIDMPKALRQLVLAKGVLESSDPLTDKAVSYKVRIWADKEHFLDWDKPLSEQPTMLKAFEDEWKRTGEKPVDWKGMSAEQAYDRLAEHIGGDDASQTLNRAGIPGIKYLDQGSRGTSTGTHNYVVFDDKLVEITHKNGELVERPGRTMPEMAKAGEKVTSEGSAVDKAGNIRLDLIKTHEDAKNVIRQAALEHGGYLDARAGGIPLAHVEPLATALGMPVEEVMGRLRGLGREMKNDNEVRFAIQSMIQSAEDTSAAMKKADLSGSTDDLIELQRLRMRHSVLQEQVAGLTAEWGRTGNVFQEFGDKVKDAQSLGRFLKDKRSESIDDLRAMAKAGAALDPRTQLPKFLQDLRKPTLWEKFLYVWKNGLISGPVTHTKYAIANTAFMAKDILLDTPAAAAIGKVASVFKPEDLDRVYFGEALAKLNGIIMGTPDAAIAAFEALKTGIPTQLPRQTSLNIVNPFTQMKPAVGGKVGAVIGAPSHGVSMIHTFFNFLGYSAEIEAQAYRQAVKDGFHPIKDRVAFWERQSDHAMFPQEEWMDAAVIAGAKANFALPLGPSGRQAQALLHKSKIGEFILPFTTVPTNIFKATMESTPLAYASPEVRSVLKGEQGQAAADMAWGRVVGGSALMTMFASWAVNDTVTGDGPVDPKAQAEWRLTHQPRSVRMGDFWYSYDRFGPVGDLVFLASNLTEAGYALGEGEYAEAAGHAVASAGKWLTETTGMQGLSDLIKVTQDPKRYGEHYASNVTASLIPFSSLLGQSASILDPNARDAHGIINAAKNKIPYVRQSLLPMRDWAGTPVVNALEYSVVRKLPVNQNPVDMEMQRLNINPTKVAKEISGVKLTPEQWDEYQVVAGGPTRMALESWVKQPDWYGLPPAARENIIKSTIKDMRAKAATVMQMRHPELIQQGVQQRVERFTNTDKQSRKFRRVPDPGVDVDPQALPEPAQ